VVGDVAEVDLFHHNCDCVEEAVAVVAVVDAVDSTAGREAVGEGVVMYTVVGVAEGDGGGVAGVAVVGDEDHDSHHHFVNVGLGTHVVVVVVVVVYEVAEMVVDHEGSLCQVVVEVVVVASGSTHWHRHDRIPVRSTAVVVVVVVAAAAAHGSRRTVIAAVAAVAAVAADTFDRTFVHH